MRKIKERLRENENLVRVWLKENEKIGGVVLIKF